MKNESFKENKTSVTAEVKYGVWGSNAFMKGKNSLYQDWAQETAEACWDIQISAFGWCLRRGQSLSNSRLRTEHGAGISVHRLSFFVTILQGICDQQNPQKIFMSI